MKHTCLNRRDWFKVSAAAALGTAVSAEAREAHRVAERLDKVPRKQLGTTGRDIPILLMGGSHKFDPVYDRSLHLAYREGVNYFDTAQSYANRQAHLTLAPFIDQIGRDKLWITSKVANRGASAVPERSIHELERMLPDLGIDRLNMFFMHGIDHPRQLESDFIRMGQEVKKRGYADLFGFSCHGKIMVEMLNRAAKIGTAGIDCIMFRYNFTYYGDYELNKAIDACKKAGIGLIAMKTMGSVPADSEMVKKFQSDNWTLHQAKLKAVWADERLDSAVSEMTNTQQVRENTAAAKSLTQLSMREFQQLNQFAARSAHLRCQGCAEICESRVSGDLKIADSLRYLMYAECYGKADEARKLYADLDPVERAFRAVDLRDATAACPQGIDIAKRLERAESLLA